MIGCIFEIRPSEGHDLMKKFALALMASAALMLGFGSMASAATYPPDQTLPPGGSFTVVVKCSPVGADVVFTFNSVPPQTVTAKCTATTAGLGQTSAALTAGEASATFTAPTAAGTYTVSYTGAASGSVAINVVTDTPPTQGGSTNGGGSGTLPSAGSDSTNTGMIIGAGALLIGLGLFFTARTRRDQDLSTGSIG